LKLAGDGKMKGAVHRRPVVYSPAVEMRPAVMPRRKFDPSQLKHGNGLRMSGGMCQGCGMMNDHFIFADASL